MRAHSKKTRRIQDTSEDTRDVEKDPLETHERMGKKWVKRKLPPFLVKDSRTFV